MLAYSSGADSPQAEDKTVNGGSALLRSGGWGALLLHCPGFASLVMPLLDGCSRCRGAATGQKYHVLPQFSQCASVCFSLRDSPVVRSDAPPVRTAAVTSPPLTSDSAMRIPSCEALRSSVRGWYERRAHVRRPDASGAVEPPAVRSERILDAGRWAPQSRRAHEDASSAASASWAAWAISAAPAAFGCTPSYQKNRG